MKKINRYFASIYLSMVGDKIGFNNGKREKNYDTIILTDNPDAKIMSQGICNLLIFKFISEGGVSGIILDTLSISDDTIMNKGTIYGLIENYKNRNELYSLITQHYIDDFKDVNKMRDFYLAGRQTLEAIKSIMNGTNWRLLPYNKSAGGNGGPMRCMPIGLSFYSTNNLLHLIESSIMICSITHPNTTAFIGSIISALFTSYGVRDMNPETWIFELVNLLESNIIDDIIEKIKPTFIEQFKEDKKSYLHKVMTYIETSFENYNYIITGINQRSIYPWIRAEYYFENFSSNKKIFYPGSGSDDVIIIAYDCLMMSKNNFEKLIYTSMINIGDSDTIGTIAAGWYGALYGFENVPLNLNLESNDMFNDMKDLANLLYDKYYEKDINYF
jgi:ADP-ribosylarginine hydrolase